MMAKSHGFLFLFLHLIMLVLSAKLPSEEEQVTKKANGKMTGVHMGSWIFGNAFGEFTEKIGHEIYPATRELLHHLKERRFSIIVEPSAMYMGAAAKIVNEYNDKVVSVEYLTVSEANYTFEVDFESILHVTLEASREAKVVVLLMDLRLAKECLAAAYDLQLNTDDRVFVAFEVDFSFMSAYQTRPFKWSTMGFVTSNSGTITNFLFRSRKLCWMWEHTFIVMVTLPEEIIHAINRRLGMSHGNRLLDINIENVDENVRFSAVGNYHAFVNKKGDTKYPLVVYRYGNTMDAGGRCANMLTNTMAGNKVLRSSFPKMHPVAHYQLIKQKQCTSCAEKWKLSLVRKNKLHKYWPSGQPACGIEGDKCVDKGSFHFNESIFIISGAVLLVLVFIVVQREFMKTRKAENDVDKILIPIAEYKEPVDV